MSKKILFWIFLIIGIAWIAGVSYWYISGVENLNLKQINWEENFTSEDPATQTFFRGVLLLIIPLLITALIFYFIGLLFGKKSEEDLYKIEQENQVLKNELIEKENKIDTMKVLYTGGKIERRRKKESVWETNEEKEITNPIEKNETEISKDEVINKDDLKIIEGIGEKIEFFLNESGIYTWEQLSVTKEEELKNILLIYGGISYKIHNPSTWPQQAELAKQNKWEELNTLKDKIKKG